MKLTPREPTPEMVEAERVKFEAWCDAEGIDASYWLRCDKHTGYENGQTADYWTGWKARARHDAAWNAAAAHAQGLRERWVVVRETTLDVGDGDDVRTGGKPELGYALIRDAATFTNMHAALAAIRSGAKPLPLGWVVMRLSRLLPDLYTHPAAPQPAALPELSDAEIDLLMDAECAKGGSGVDIHRRLARAVIAAMKGKQ